MQVGKKYNGEKAIISLTSWKARINTVAKTLFNLIKNCPDFHIVLVLSEEEFPLKEKELPENLMLFVDNELIEILWIYPNYKSFKKWIFTSKKYPNVPIITADDDCVYTCNYAQKLYDAWINSKKQCIITNDGGNKPTLKWPRGPNTLYTYSYFKNIDLDLLCKEYFKQKFTFVEEDVVFGLIAKKLGIEIIDLKRLNKFNSIYYLFHDEINPQSTKGWNFTKRYNILHKFVDSIWSKIYRPSKV